MPDVCRSILLYVSLRHHQRVRSVLLLTLREIDRTVWQPIWTRRGLEYEPIIPRDLLRGYPVCCYAQRPLHHISPIYYHIRGNSERVESAGVVVKIRAYEVQESP